MEHSGKHKQVTAFLEQDAHQIQLAKINKASQFGH